MKNNIIRVVSDIHGKFRQYKRIIKDCDRSIQVGDLGIGFLRYGGALHNTTSQNPPFDAMSKGEHLFQRGNHDNLSVCKKHKFWIPDGTVKDNMMFIGGEESIDREWRQEGYNWWADEQLSYQEFERLIDIYLTVRPEIMITHGAPTTAVGVLCSYNHMRFFHPSRTTQALQAMFDLHKPRLWLHGHFHLAFDQVIDGTRFICQPELGWVDCNTETLEVKKPNV